MVVYEVVSGYRPNTRYAGDTLYSNYIFAYDSALSEMKYDGGEWNATGPYNVYGDLKDVIIVRGWYSSKTNKRIEILKRYICHWKHIC